MRSSQIWTVDCGSDECICSSKAGTKEVWLSQRKRALNNSALEPFGLKVALSQEMVGLKSSLGTAKGNAKKAGMRRFLINQMYRRLREAVVRSHPLVSSVERITEEYDDRLYGS